MAYGRLEVYWPDGRLETHLLDEDTVSVGRAEGNTVALDTESISRYHFSITRAGDMVTLTDLDSQNGTYADGMKLASNEPHELHDVEEIQIGSLRIIFRMIDESPTIPIEAQNDETQRVERDKANIRLDLDKTRLDVWPAASGSAEIAILNTGDAIQHLTVRVSGMPGEWLRLTRPEVAMDSGETVYVLLNIKPPRRPNTVPARYEVHIEVAPVDNPELSVHAILEVNVQAYSGFGMAMIPQADVGDPVSVFLHNQGSGNLNLSMKGKDKNHALQFNLPDTILTLQAGQRLRVDVDITARKPPLVGAPEELPFIIEVQSQDDSHFLAAASGKVKVAPRFPTWMVMTAGAIALSVFFIGLVLLSGLLRPPEPIINSFSISNDQIAQGDELIVRVDAEHIDTYDVLVNTVAVLQGYSGEAEELPIDTTDFSGDLDIRIIGRNRIGDTEISATSFVYIPLEITRFVAQPSILMQYVTQTVAIEWEVQGAAFVQISGLTDFSKGILQSSTQYSSTHRIEASGIPSEPLEITLYAEDVFGNFREQTITLATSEPHCTATRATIVREGPDERFQQVATLSADNQIVVLAQDVGAGWLRVRLPGEVRGWAEREVLNCQDFDLSALQFEANIPDLPTATPLPVIEPTNPPPQPTRTIAPPPTQQGG